MATARTKEGWSQYLDGADRELSLAEFTALELTHLCQLLNEIACFADRTHLATANIDGRLDRLERCLEQQTAYRSTPALVSRDEE